MDLITFRDYCLAKKGTSEHFPFDESTLVIKVGGKMFFLADINSHPLSFNLKCDPEKALELREHYPCITAGYHMNKKHWNTIKAVAPLTIFQCFEMIDHSYQLVVNSLTKKQRVELLDIP